jgi:indolepyruvate ferredoxin oxidoreductase
MSHAKPATRPTLPLSPADWSRFRHLQWLRCAVAAAVLLFVNQLVKFGGLFPFVLCSTLVGILVTGIGGTGVITIGQIIGMAAHLEGKGVSVLDMSGLAQKYGAVMSHVQVAPTAEGIHATRLDTGGAHLVLGCDLVVSASTEAIAKMAQARTRAVVNATVTPTAEFVKNPNWQLPGSDLRKDISDNCDTTQFVAATELATGLMGDAIATNMFMLGYAYQQGWVPLSGAALERAIELNGVAVDFNKKSFLWGRRAAVDEERVKRIASPADIIPIDQHFSRSVDELIDRRAKFLAQYQNPRLAKRYLDLVNRARRVEHDRTGSTKLAEAIARAYHKLLAYKDEYEVARLLANGDLKKKIEGMFEGDYKLVFHLAPPRLARTDPATGEPRKRAFGPWMGPVFKLLQRLKFLRGTPLDPFGYTEERRMERALIGEYERIVEDLIKGLTPQTHALAVQIAAIPEEMRGFGYIKKRNVEAARKKRDEMLARFNVRADAPARVAA